VPEATGCFRIAHRGASGHCPENTRAAFVRAIELGSEMVELDCQLTRDGAVIVMHDETLDRTTSGTGRVRDRTLAEVKSFDAGSWFGPAFVGEEVLTLDEAIECLRGRVEMNLEMKGDDEPGRLEIACAGIVSSYRFLQDTVFSSFSARRAAALRELLPGARLGVLMDAGTRLPAGLAAARELGAEALHPDRSLVDAGFVAAAHAAGLAVRVWPVNDAAEIARLVALGVDAIFTDFPERLLRVGATERRALR
jgi:glycerophosphoryl diester phosphodiesterase